MDSAGGSGGCHPNEKRTENAGQANDRQRAAPDDLLSGEQLVDAPALKAELWKREPEAVGGEMEASGIVDEASRRTVRWLIVKAICDWGEHKYSAAQPMAALNAMRFVFAMIAGKLIPRP